MANSLTMQQQDFWGSKKSYLFNPATESYESVSDLNIARWYPTLVGLADGRVLAVSGLNQYGQIVQGQSEIYTPSTRTWNEAPALQRVFPTYPALFLMPSGNLFYSGSNAGYGSATIGRTPGVWDLGNNSFKVVPGLRDPTDTETSGSVLLPPAQAQKYMIIGGGGVGESKEATARTGIADLNSPEPHFSTRTEPGPADALSRGGDHARQQGDHRGRVQASTAASTKATSSNATHTTPRRTSSLAWPTPPSGATTTPRRCCCPTGRIVTLGGNPLYGNKEDTSPGYFEQRIEIYSPPYLYHGKRPGITGGPQRGQARLDRELRDARASAIQTSSLIRPSATTHVTDFEQRSIALNAGPRDRAGGITVTIPRAAASCPLAGTCCSSPAPEAPPRRRAGCTSPRRPIRPPGSLSTRL